MQLSTKKVKTREDVVLNMPSDSMEMIGEGSKVPVHPLKQSYKDSLFMVHGTSINAEDGAIEDIDKDAFDSEDH
ncbi:hypothetical protein AHAS_Ahas20G0266400 [Arachis hypogaea]